MLLPWPRLLFSTLDRPRTRPLSIFIFHRVLADRDPIFPGEPIASEFDEIVGWIRAWFEVLPLAEAADRFAKGTLPPRSACITFDDGYADNFTTALPILLRHRAPATFFIATGFLNGGRMWNDTVIESVRRTPNETVDFTSLGIGVVRVQAVPEKQQAVRQVIASLKHRPPTERDDAVAAVAELCGAPQLPHDLMMTDSQVRDLHASGMGVGAHTVTHPILARCDEVTARNEIAESRNRLEGLLGERVSLFAYPNGQLEKDYTPEHVRIVRELGFAAAVSTNPGASRPGDDPFQLRRFTPWDRKRGRFALRLAQNLLSQPRESAA